MGTKKSLKVKTFTNELKIFQTMKNWRPWMNR